MTMHARTIGNTVLHVRKARSLVCKHTGAEVYACARTSRHAAREGGMRERIRAPAHEPHCAQVRGEVLLHAWRITSATLSGTTAKDKSHLPHSAFCGIREH